jgi:hypothetical protein
MMIYDDLPIKNGDIPVRKALNNHRVTQVISQHHRIIGSMMKNRGRVT